MVEIVGIDEKKYKKVTCSNCASILRYLPCDVKTETFKNYDPNVYIICPNCKEGVYLSW